MDADALRRIGTAPTTQERWAREDCDDDRVFDTCRSCGEVASLEEVDDGGGDCPWCGDPFYSVCRYRRHATPNAE